MKRRFLSVLIALVLVLSFTLVTAVPVMAAVTVTEASGGDAISADDFGTGAWTPLTGPVIEESVAAEIGTGTIIFNVPGGFEFNTLQDVTATVTGDATQLVLASTTATPTATTITFTVNSVSADNPSTITFSDIQVRPTAGTLASDDILTTDSTSVIAGVTHGTTPFGTLTMVAGAATQLAFTTQPAGSVSGIALTTQPVVEAQDQFGNTDTTYITNVVAATDDLGTLTGTTTKAAVAGVATFTDLVYTATADGEIFQIDVTSGGLTQATSNGVTCDVVATQLVFTTQPTAGTNSGALLGTQPIVTAKDAGNLVDTGFTETVTITADVGTLSGDADVAAVGGVAEFTDLVHTASADNQVTTLTADDEATAPDLPTVDADTFTTLVIATKLVFTTQPAAGANSGALLGTQPVVTAQDADDTVDTDFTETVTITADVGALSGDVDIAAVGGVATFTDLVHTASADNQVTTLTADDEAAAPDLSPVNADTFTTLVIATKLVFTTQPAGSVSGIALTTQPVVEAQDAADVQDEDYVTDVVASEDDAGTLTGTTTQTPVAGVATFTDLVYTATADGETFQIDVTSGTLTGATSNGVTCDVEATKLAIVTQPTGAVSGSALLIQPVINAVDADGIVDTDWTTNCAVSKESGVGDVTGTPVAMVAGVATFTDVTVTESPVVHGSYTLEFTSGALVAVVSDAFKVYGKVLDLNDDAWTLISTDDYIISSGDNASVFEGSVSLKYKYTGSSYLSATAADLEPVEALYVKTTSDDGWVGLNYSTAGSPGASIKSLVAGWNLVSSATSDASNADVVLSPLRYVQIGEQEGVGLATLVSQGDYNLNIGDLYLATLTTDDWTTLDTTTLNAFDGYWVYMNAAKSFGVIP